MQTPSAPRAIINDSQASLETPAVDFINTILQTAIEKQVSDIHFEPYEGHYRIRFRRDGLLSTVSQPPASLAPMITTRLKIMANLDIAERRLPQDGRFTLTITPKHPIDFRINTCPTLQGEKIVLRLLKAKSELLTVAALGMPPAQEALFLEVLQRSQGMILVTGPTGSGKTTTLYTGLHCVNTLEKNISTIEDPVEIQLNGINQIPINPKTGLTFAVALRALLRQDPDIMMVGEIRDAETAEIAINAAQTGHLVLSTLHTNSAVETVLRLINMGVPHYNVADSISLIIAQRLVRRLCVDCKQPQNLSKIAALKAGFAKHQLDELRLFVPGTQVCQHCSDGYRGRLAIFEVVPLSQAMARLISHRCNSHALSEQSQRENIPTLYQAGLRQVLEGHTSLVEINPMLKA